MTPMPIYAVNHGDTVRVSRKGHERITWLENWPAGRVDYGAAAW